MSRAVPAVIGAPKMGTKIDVSDASQEFRRLIETQRKSKHVSQPRSAKGKLIFISANSTLRVIIGENVDETLIVAADIDKIKAVASEVSMTLDPSLLPIIAVSPQQPSELTDENYGRMSALGIYVFRDASLESLISHFTKILRQSSNGYRPSESEITPPSSPPAYPSPRSDAEREEFIHQILKNWKSL